MAQHPPPRDSLPDYVFPLDDEPEPYSVVMPGPPAAVTGFDERPSPVSSSLPPMRAEMRARERAARRRRNLVVGGVVGVLSLAVGVGVLWPDGDQWREQPMASGLIPENPGDEWFDTESPSSWMRVANRQEGEPTATSTTTVLPRTTPPDPPVLEPTVDAVETTVTGTPVPTTKPNGQPLPPKPTNTNKPTKPTTSGPTVVPTVEPTSSPTSTSTPTPTWSPPPPPGCTIIIFGICL